MYMMAKVKTEIGNDYCPQALFLMVQNRRMGSPILVFSAGLDIIVPQRDSG